MPEYDPQTLAILVELRQAAGLSQDQAGASLGLKGKRRRDSVSAWELGASRPHHKRRPEFIVYLLDRLGLRRHPRRFHVIWNQIMVEQWGWGSLTLEEWRRYFPGGIPQAVLDGQSPAAKNNAQPTPIWQFPPRPTPLPEIDTFVGREQELRDLAHRLANSRLALITGMPGVGKTALAAALARRSANLADIFWHRFRPGEDPGVVIWKLASFLFWRGEEGLWCTLQNALTVDGRLLVPDIALEYILQLLPGQGGLLCLDDFQHVAQNSPAQRLAIELPARKVSLIIISRRVPGFVRSTQFRCLAGLTKDDVHHLLRARGLLLPRNLADKLYACTEGNARLLALTIDALMDSPSPGFLIKSLLKINDIERFLIAEVDGELVEEERSVMEAVAILLGYPGTQDAVETILGRGSIGRPLQSLNDRHLLISQEEDGERKYSQHVTVRAFYYSLLGNRERRAMHRQAAQYYETQKRDALRAALHYERAGESERATELVMASMWPAAGRIQPIELRWPAKQR